MEAFCFAVGIMVGVGAHMLMGHYATGAFVAREPLRVWLTRVLRGEDDSA